VSNRSDLGSHAFDTAMMELCKCSGQWSFRMSCLVSRVYTATAFLDN